MAPRDLQPFRLSYFTAAHTHLLCDGAAQIFITSHEFIHSPSSCVDALSVPGTTPGAGDTGEKNGKVVLSAVYSRARGGGGAVVFMEIQINKYISRGGRCLKKGRWS